MNIYVAGPVLRQLTDQRWIGNMGIDEIYSLIRRELTDHGIEVLLPEADAEIDHLDAAGFSAVIRSRIDKADAVITVLAEDQGVPGEAGWAAARGKPQVILHDPNRPVPRFLLGLDRVRDGIPVEGKSEVLDAVRLIAGDSEGESTLLGDAF